MRLISTVLFLLLLVHVSDAQQVKKVKQPQTPFVKKEPAAEIAMRNAKKAFIEGDYRRAKDLCNIAQNTIDYAKEKEATALIRKCDDVIRLKDEALKFFIKKDFKHAAEKYGEAKELNPKDPDSRRGEELALEPVRLVEDKFITYTQTLPCRDAITYLKQRRIIKPSAAIEAEIITRTEKCKDIVAEPTTVEQLALLKRQLQYRFNNCDYDGLILKANGILKLDYNNSQAKKYRFIAEEIKRRKREINELVNDLSKNSLVIANYDYIKNAMPNCPQDEYFMFLFRKGESLFYQNNCKQCIKYFIKAEGVSPKLALKYNISQFITRATEQCTVDPCKDKLVVVQQMLKDANTLYSSCQYIEALAKYQSAKNFLVSSNCEDKNGLITAWEPIVISIKSNFDKVRLFNETIRKADSLLIESECAKAIVLYKSVDSINVNCEKLVKNGIPKKIKQAENCLQEKCVSENETLAQKSVSLGFYIDALNYYCEAKKCTKDSMKLIDIKKKICEVQKRFNEREQKMVADNPKLLCVSCCEPKEIKVVSDTTVKDSSTVISHDFLIGSDLYKSFRPNFGIRKKYSSFLRNDLDGSLSLIYTRFDEKMKNGSIGQLRLNTFSLPLAVYFHLPNSFGKPRPYLFGSLDPSYSIGKETTTILRNVSGFGLSFSYGLGIDIRQLNKVNFSLEVYGQNNVILSDFSKKYIDRNYFGIRLGIGVSKLKSKTVQNVVTKKVPCDD